MAGRILALQRLREMGRLRTGYTGNRGPVRSRTWILTSSQSDYLDAAANIWGGKVEAWTPLNGTEKQYRLTTETDTLEGFLPPGDPLTQNNELWNRGGAVRRCNGETELKSNKPCLCLAAFGEDWYRQDKKVRCQPYSQLNILLLQLPDVGQWRHVTKSFYAAGEIAGMVDLIKAQVGPKVMVPVSLVIDQRKKVADGTTTPYPVPIIRLRGGTSGGELLAGNVPTLELSGGLRREAIEAAPAAQAPDWTGRIGAAATMETLNGVRDDMRAAGVRDQALITAWREREALLTRQREALERMQRSNGGRKPQPDAAPPAVVEAVEVVDAEPEPDVEAAWSLVLSAAGGKGWNSDALEQRINARFRKASDELDGWQMTQLLDDIKSGAVA